MASKKQYPALSKFSMLLVNNNRSKAYLQSLIANGHIPSFVIVLDSGKEKLPEQTDNDMKIHAGTKQKLIHSCKETGISFDEKEHIPITLQRLKISHQILSTIDINSEEVIHYSKESPGNYIIYSGTDGAILRKDLLSCGKFFLHVHPGWLPDYKGSTVLYYSILLERKIGASVIIMTEGIDSGPILHRCNFQPSKEVDIDYIFDPSMRAATLLDFFNSHKGKSLNPVAENDPQKGNFFFIIHPVLKHLSILSLK